LDRHQGANSRWNVGRTRIQIGLGPGLISDCRRS
jgi:hypothetical protein